MTALLSRRSLYVAAWTLFLASVVLPAPAGSFAGGSSGMSGLLVVGKAVAWSRAAPGSAEALDFWRMTVLTLALFSNVAFAFTVLLRNHRTVSPACTGLLLGAVAVGGSVAFLFPEFARLPAYWLWLTALIALAAAFTAFPGSGAAANVASARRAASRSADAEVGDVPQLVWLWLGFVVFWLAVSGFHDAHTRVTPDTRAAAPPEGALTSYVTDDAHLIPADVAAQLGEALARFEKETSNQIAVAIYPRAPAGAVEAFTIAMADRSRLGRKGLDNGAILFVFAAEKSARLEVGYGLEGVLTDVDAHRILDTLLVPAFARGDYADGLDATLGAIFLAIQDAYRRGHMPGKAPVFWRQLQVEVPRLVREAGPALNALDLDARIGIACLRRTARHGHLGWAAASRPAGAQRRAWRGQPRGPPSVQHGHGKRRARFDRRHPEGIRLSLGDDRRCRGSRGGRGGRRVRRRGNARALVRTMAESAFKRGRA